MKSSRYAGRTLLLIGDSQSANNEYGWQKTTSELLGMKLINHSKGGISALKMVDGDGAPSPEFYDPYTNATKNIYPLSIKDVENASIIVVMGLYNMRNMASDPAKCGRDTDVYPKENTFKGQLNYALNRVDSLLAAAHNRRCRIYLCSPHKYGSYSWNDKTFYEDGSAITKSIEDIAKYRNLNFIDLSLAPIDSTNWNLYHSSPKPLRDDYLANDGINTGINKPFSSVESLPSASENIGKWVTVEGVPGSYRSNGDTWEKKRNPAPWKADQLHLNRKGHKLIGTYIAEKLLEKRVNILDRI